MLLGFLGLLGLRLFPISFIQCLITDQPVLTRLAESLPLLLIGTILTEFPDYSDLPIVLSTRTIAETTNVCRFLHLSMMTFSLFLIAHPYREILILFEGSLPSPFQNNRSCEISCISFRFKQGRRYEQLWSRCYSRSGCVHWSRRGWGLGCGHIGQRHVNFQK